MLALVIAKCLDVGFDAVKYYSMRDDGMPVLGWSVMYYIFHLYAAAPCAPARDCGAWPPNALGKRSIRGCLLLLVLVLVAAGLAYVKPYLTKREKVFVLILVPLQALSRTAQIIVEQTEMGSAGWQQWSTVFRLVDFACFIAVVVPIVWTVNHLKRAMHADSKGALRPRRCVWVCAGFGAQHGRRHLLGR